MLDEHTVRHLELLWEANALGRELPDEYRGCVQDGLELRRPQRRTDRLRQSIRGLRARLNRP